MQTTSCFVDVRVGETLKVSGPASIELLHKSGQLARLRITAALDVVVSKTPTPAMQGRDKHALVEPS